jgi:hypothetical protein
MGKSADIRAARAAGVMCVRNHLQVALPPGARRVRNDIQIRGLEQA